jgi:hypothetical protein
MRFLEPLKERDDLIPELKESVSVKDARILGGKKCSQTRFRGHLAGRARGASKLKTIDCLVDASQILQSLSEVVLFPFSKLLVRSSPCLLVRPIAVFGSVQRSEVRNRQLLSRRLPKRTDSFISCCWCPLLAITPRPAKYPRVDIINLYPLVHIYSGGETHLHQNHRHVLHHFLLNRAIFDNHHH